MLFTACPVSQEVCWPGSVLGKGGDTFPEVAEAREPVGLMLGMGWGRGAII